MRARLSRRDFIKTSAIGAGLQLPAWQARAATTAQFARTIARGPFQSTWESLVQNYRVPEWFRARSEKSRRFVFPMACRYWDEPLPLGGSGMKLTHNRTF